MAKVSIWILIAVIGVLSLAAGAAKLTSAPQEVQFFQEAGVGLGWMLALGALQIAGGILLIFHRLRKVGAVLAAIGFALSAAMIFATGNTVFAAFSMLPVGLALLLFWLTDR